MPEGAQSAPYLVICCSFPSSVPKSSDHLVAQAPRLCGTVAGETPAYCAFHGLRVSQRLMFNCLGTPIFRPSSAGTPLYIPGLNRLAKNLQTRSWNKHQNGGPGPP
jgi:hypothetical protein